jgi:hypothetical protein
MIEPAISVETAYALQDEQKRQVEGTTQVGVRNIQFLKAPVPIGAGKFKTFESVFNP